MKKTLIAYSSKSGATEQVAKIIEEVLKEKSGLEVELANLEKTHQTSLSTKIS